jgi:flagellar basal-body rod protein FlgC
VRGERGDLTGRRKHPTMDTYDITASALTAQRLRLDTIASNLANVNTTRKPDGSIGAYHRRNVVFAPLLDKAIQNEINPVSMNVSNGDKLVSFGGDGSIQLNVGLSASQKGGMGVQVAEIAEDKGAARKVYDPSHPDADKDGFVDLPNVNVVTEMVDMISASRAYEANVSALQSAKAMAQASLEI